MAVTAGRAMKAAAASNTPFTDAELDKVVLSLQKAAAEECPVGNGVGAVAVAVAASEINWQAVRNVVAKYAHQPHADWHRTEAAADALADALSGPSDATFCRIFHRVGPLYPIPQLAQLRPHPSPPRESAQVMYAAQAKKLRNIIDF